MINWVDLIMVAVLILGISSARKSEMITEFVVLFGFIISACISLHYYARLGEFISTHVVLPPNSYELAAFLLINGIIIGITLLTKGGWLVILKISIKREIDNYISYVLAFFKTMFMCSLLIIALAISGKGSMESASKNSLGFYVFRKPALWAYSSFYNGFVGPFFKGEPMNQRVFRAMQGRS